VSSPWRRTRPVPPSQGYDRGMAHTRSLRRPVATVVAAVSLSFVAACGSGGAPPATTGGSSSAGSSSAATSATATGQAGGDSAYCDALKSGQKELESIPSKITDKAALEQGLTVLQKIEASAPAEVKAAWGDFVDFVKTATSGNTSAMAGALQKMQAAGTTIAAHAKSTCNLDMS
jgi:hypothetical protein